MSWECRRILKTQRGTLMTKHTLLRKYDEVENIRTFVFEKSDEKARGVSVKQDWFPGYTTETY